MKKRILSLLIAATLLLGCFPLSAFAAEEIGLTYEEWQNDPEAYAVNREDASAHFYPFDTEQKAMDGYTMYPDESEYYQSLDAHADEGLWKFSWAERPDDRLGADGNLDFTELSYDINTADEAWDDMTVPSAWQINWDDDGEFVYDHAIYTNNSPYPWEGYGNSDISSDYADATAPTVFNPVGTYRRTFTIENDWTEADHQVLLNFAGVLSNCYVWLNGHEVGYAEDSFTAKAFDITPYLDFDGDNVLTVQVFRWSDASYMEDADMIRLSGIFRSVYLTASPKVGLYDYQINMAPVEEGNYTGEWSLDISALVRDYAGDNHTDDVTLTATLYDAEEVVAGSTVLDFADDFSERDNWLGNPYTGADGAGAITVSGPELWSAENPYLYKLVFTVEAVGHETQYICSRVGFREVKVVNQGTDDARILINGSRILFYGANLHEFNGETGNTMTEEQIRTDLKLMKQYNINAMRLSHYPHDTRYYDLADEYGIYVVDEANVECHSRQNTVGEPVWGPMLRDRMSNMVERTKNYSSVVIWSLGNENMNTSPTQEQRDTFNQWCTDWVRERDPSRPIHTAFESTGPDIFSEMYDADWASTVTSQSTKKPAILAEYAIGRGNANGNLDVYISAFDSIPRAQGGFIWEWTEKNLLTPADPEEYGYDENGELIWYYAHGGDWGDDPNDGKENSNGVLLTDRTPKPQTTQVKYEYQMLRAELNDDETFTVYNKFLFTNANAYNAHWELVQDDTVIQEGEFENGLDVPPAPAGVSDMTMSSATFSVPFTTPVELQEGSEYFFNLYFTEKGQPNWADEEGHQIAIAQFEVDFSQGKTEPVAPPQGAVEMEDDDGIISITGDEFSLEISKETGVITTYAYGGEEIMVSGPEPNFTRAAVETDKLKYGIVTPGYSDLNNWRTVGSTRTTNSVTAAYDGTAVVVTAQGDFTEKVGAYTITYTVFANGEMKLDFSYDFSDLSGTNLTPEVGSMMTLAPGLENITWFGREGETYVDRKTGSMVGLHETTVTDNLVEYISTQETGNKVDTRWYALTRDNGTGILLKSDYGVDGEALLEYNALHYTPFQMDPVPFVAFVSNEDYKPYQLYHGHGVNDAQQPTYLRVNYMGMGVGGDDAWMSGLAHVQYRPQLAGQVVEFGYSILPIDGLDVEDAKTYYRTAYDYSNETTTSCDITITGEATYGETLMAVVSGNPGVGTAITWMSRNGETIGTGSTYTIGAEDVGNRLTVSVTSDNLESPLTATTGEIGKAEQMPPIVEYKVERNLADGAPTLVITQPTLEDADFGTNQDFYPSLTANTFPYPYNAVESDTYYFRLKETDTHSQSPTTTLTVNFAKEIPTTPEPFTLLFAENGDGTLTVEIPAVAGCEYSFDGITYTDDNKKTDCQPGELVTGFIRVKTTNTANPSVAVADAQRAPKLSNNATVEMSAENFVVDETSITMVTAPTSSDGSEVEYSLNGSAYVTLDTDNLPVFTGLDMEQSHIVSVRSAERLTREAGVDTQVILGVEPQPEMAEVTVRGVDENDTELYSETDWAEVGTVYTATAQQVTGYTLVGSGTEQITVAGDDNIITFRYQAELRPEMAEVTLRGVDENGVQLYSDTEQVQVDTTYTVTARELEGYTLIGSSQRQITVAEGGNTILFLYRAEPEVEMAEVTVRGIAINGEELYSETDQAQVGAVYTARARELEGYTLVGDATRRIAVEAEENVITFVYLGETPPPVGAEHTITASGGPGGSVSPESITAAEGESAVFSVTPDDGYKVGAVLVDGVKRSPSDVEGDIYTFTAVDAGHVLRVLFIPDQEEDFAARFTDVAKSNAAGETTWYYGAVNTLTGLGLINGKDEDTFAPADNITRSEFTKLVFELALTLGCDVEETDESPFTDMPNEDYWAEGYIGWAYESGIITGYGGGRFGPEDEILRQDMAVIMERFFVEYMGYELPGNMEKAFNDASEISNYAQGAVTYVVRVGLMEGDDTGAFGPKNYALRQEVVQLFYNYLIG